MYDNLQPMVDSQDHVQDDIKVLMKLISNNDAPPVDSLLKRIPKSLDLTEIKNNENGYSLLHLAVFKDSEEIILLLFKHIIEVQHGDLATKKMKIKQWINLQSEGKEGFTAIHFAAFNGSISIVRFLERHGADNYFNILHIAAQGNQPSTITYFVNKNFDINSRDKFMSTPLHWA